MSEQIDDFLSHHGVVGMKWGKHKAKSSGGSSSGGGASAKKVEKAAIKSARKDIYKGAAASMKANKGRTVASALLLGGSATTGITLARAAGLSRGKSLAVGLLGGAPGGMLAVELSARKAVKGD